jgi:hypothetical protein
MSGLAEPAPGLARGEWREIKVNDGLRHVLYTGNKVKPFFVSKNVLIRLHKATPKLGEVKHHFPVNFK